MSGQDNRPVAISVEKMTKTFKLPHEKQNSIKSRLINFKKRGYEKQIALKDISFEVKKGEFFGIVGRNGSGKSTLLKLLAGIYTPDKGKITINGRLTPFIELGVGFNPELSGRDNVFLNGALLGFSRSEMSKMYDEIVEFAELERFMDQKLKNYSSGMQVRLAFSIAIRANTDILVLDEVLAVGDSNFQKKCFEYFAKLKNDKKTILLVTHDMTAVERFCTSAMLINDSKLVDIGAPDKIAKLYNDINRTLTSQEIKKFNSRKAGQTNVADKQVSIDEVWVTDETGRRQDSFEPEQTITAHCKLSSRIDAHDMSVVLKLGDQGGPPLVNISTRMKDLVVNLKAGGTGEVTWQMPNIFNNGTYYLSVQILADDRVTVFHEILDAFKFEVSGWKYPFSIIHPVELITVKAASKRGNNGKG